MEGLEHGRRMDYVGVKATFKWNDWMERFSAGWGFYVIRPCPQTAWRNKVTSIYDLSLMIYNTWSILCLFVDRDQSYHASLLSLFTLLPIVVW